jgi:hypothetical protein
LVAVVGEEKRDYMVCSIGMDTSWEKDAANSSSSSSSSSSSNYQIKP